MKTMLKSNQGMAMMMVLVIMVIFLSITGASLLLSGLNLKTASNLRTGASVLQVADAGIQHALATVSQGTILPNVAWVLETNVVPTTTFPAGSQYSYVVTAVNGPATNQATFTSTATGPNGAKAVVQAVVERRVGPTIPGTVNLLGEAESNFPASNWVIDGNDFDLNGNATANPAKLGIAVGDNTAPSAQTPQQALDSVNNALSWDQKDHHVLGLGRDQSTNTPSTAIDNTLTKQATTDFINYLKTVADSYLTVRNTTGGATAGDVSGTISNSTDANNNLTIAGNTVDMGTTASPKIVFFEGVAAGQPGDQRLIFSGSITGAGVLVMKENDLQFLGGLNWKGLIIASGPDTSVYFSGTASQSILGALVNNETDTDPGYIELTLNNNYTTIKRSQAALDLIQTIMNNKASLRVVSWKQNLS